MKIIITSIIFSFFIFNSALAVSYKTGEINNLKSYKTSVENFISKVEGKTQKNSQEKQLTIYKNIKTKVNKLYGKVLNGNHSVEKKETYRVLLGYLESLLDKKISNIESKIIDLDSLFGELYEEEKTIEKEIPKNKYSTFTKDKINILKEGTYVQGNKNAEITFIEYSDLECPFCKRLHTNGTISDILKNYDGKVNFIFKHFPLGFHEMAAMEAEALECAGEIGGEDKYYEFLEEIFANSKTNGRSYTIETISELAGTIGINSTKVSSCIESGKYTKKVSDNMSEGTSIGVNGTPGNVLINNKTGEYTLLPGAYPYANFKEKIDGLLNNGY